MVLQLSKANKTGDENKPQQALVFAKGKVGSIIANGWEWGAALDPKTGNPKLDGKIGAYPMPSHTSGQVHADVPRRLGARHPGHEQAEGPRDRLDRRLHEHGEHDADVGEGRRDPEHDHARVDPRQEPEARAVRPGGDVELVRAPRPRTGPTSRARACSRRCSPAFCATPARRSSSRRRRATGSSRSSTHGRKLALGVSAESTTLPVEPAARPARRRTGRTGRVAIAPYLLLLPALAVIAAVLGYPLYKLVALSFQQYGLFELLAHEGRWIGFDNYSQILHDREFWTVLARTTAFTAVTVSADDAARDADRAPARAARRRDAAADHDRASCSPGRCRPWSP